MPKMLAAKVLRARSRRFMNHTLWTISPNRISEPRIPLCLKVLTHGQLCQLIGRFLVLSRRISDNAYNSTAQLWVVGPELEMTIVRPSEGPFFGVHL